MNSSIPNPYIGPQSFLENERDRFFGRKTEARDLLALVVSERLVIFYAQSGAGKSSLVNTCLIPDLRARGHKIFTGRVAGDAPEGIRPDNVFVFNLLRSLAVRERNAASLAAQTISEFLQGHSGGAAEASEDEESNVLIIDQFEEIFSTHHEEWEKREGFFKQLAQALQDDPYLVIVLVMREDYIASLDPYSPLVPNRFRRRYYMQRLEREAALEAVKKPVENIRPYEDGVAERLVNDLSSIKIQKADETTDTQPGQFVEGVQLQLVCLKLWKGLGEGDRITHADLDKLGDVNLALEEHYAERVREVAERKKVSERLIREWFGKKLITPAGTRNLVLRSLRRVDGELPDDVIQALQSDLVRAEQRGASAFYELTHDRLVEPILANNKKWFDSLSPLQRQAALWNEQGRNETWLFSDRALAEAEAWAKEYQSDLTPFEMEFLKESQKNQKEKVQKLQARQQRIIVYLSIIAILVTTGLAVFGIVQADRATREAIVAQANLFLAESAKAEAISAESTAIANQEEAQRQSSIARAGELAAQAQRLIDEDLQSSLLLGIESFRRFDTPQSRSALLNVTTANPQLLQFLTGHTDSVSSLAYSPDGKLLASGSFDDSIILWDAETRQPLGSPLIGHSDDVSSVAFSPDGRTLASGSGDTTIILWDVETRRQIGQLMGHTGYVSSISFSPDGKTLASGSYDNTIIIWDLQNLESIDQLNGHTSYVASVAFSPDGNTLASGGGDNIIILWDVETRESIAQLARHTFAVTAVAFNPDGRILAAGSYDNTISLWDVKSLQPIGDLTGHTDAVISVTFSHDGKLLASGGADKTLRLWNVGSLQPVSQLTEQISYISSVAFNPDNRTIASGSYSGTIVLWDTATNQPLGQPLTGHTSFVSSIAFGPDSNILASGSFDDSIILWDVDTRQPLGLPIRGNSGGVSSVAFSPDGKFLATGGYDNNIILWDVETRQQIGPPFTGHSDDVSSVAFSPDGRTLASGSGDTTIILWDVETRQQIGQLMGHVSYVSSLVFSSTGQTLISAGCREIRVDNCNLGEIVLWDVETREQTGQFTGHTSWVTSLAISPDDQIIASGSWDNTIILWEVETHERLDQLTEHTSYISSLVFSPDGETLASGSYDSTIILWDAKTRQLSGQFIGQTTLVTTIVFSPDGESLASGSYDGTIILWDIRPASWIDLSCQRAGRNFTRTEWGRYFPNEEYRKTCDLWPLEPEPETSETPAGTDVNTTTPASTPVVIQATTTESSFASPTATSTLQIILLVTDTPRPTPPPAATATVPVFHRVINVAEGDHLNLRAGPGTRYEVITTIPYNERGIQVTGEGIQVDNAIWLPVIYDGISGWVNSYWLAPE